MKTVLLWIAIFIFSNAQSQGTRENMVEQYCRVMLTGKLFTDRLQIEVDFGDKKRDRRLRDADQKVLTFETVVDALNYMGRDGWKLMHVQETPTRPGQSPTTWYLFTKNVNLFEAFNAEDKSQRER